MALSRTLAVGLVVGAAVPAGRDDGPGAGLEPGMQLVYDSEGEKQPVWTVDSVRHEPPLRRGAACAAVYLRMGPEPQPSDERRLCLANDTLYRRDAKRGEWTIQRPVGPGMSWTSRQPNGRIVRYETGARAVEVISGRRIAVVETTITTSDSSSRPTQRLRERYALSLTTATGGVFEVPDSTQPGTWRPARRFELRAIRPPGR